MSMTPDNIPENPPDSRFQPSIPPAEAPPHLEPAGSFDSPAELRNEPNAPPPVPFKQSWQARLLGVSFAIFAFEIGLALVIFPWMGSAWDSNYFQSVGPILGNIWDEPYFRGAVSGLGLVNIYIAMLQIARVFRRT
jgi:hypothetical protein